MALKDDRVERCLRSCGSEIQHSEFHFLFCFVSTLLFLAGNSGRDPSLSVGVVFSGVQTIVKWLPVFGIFNARKDADSMHAIAHGGCMDTVRESALKADSGRKIPCRNLDSNPHQYCACLFNWTLYQLIYFRPSDNSS